MEKRVKVGILRETKKPPDRRVPLIPEQMKSLLNQYKSVGFYVQPSKERCFSDDEYKFPGITIREDLSECDLLLGIKEVDRKVLLPGKTYLFFAHVGKKQLHNQPLLQEIIDKRIKLIDYEYLVGEKGERVVAFGRYAGIVGAYNALVAAGLKYGEYSLRPAHTCRDLIDMWNGLKAVALKPQLRVLVTGRGRVAGGVMETLKICNIMNVSSSDYLTREFDVPVVCQIGPEDYLKHKTNTVFDYGNFLRNPADYYSAFLQYTKVTDILITGHYWDPHSPVFFEKKDMKDPSFRISIVADISCDINGPVPSTIKAASITDPFYDFNPHLETEEPPFTKAGNITVMAVDNLPGELPRDASADFGKQLINRVLPDLLSDTGRGSEMIKKATITENGKLTPEFSYLKDYIINGFH